MFPKNSMLFNEEFGGLFGLKIVAENKFLLYIDSIGQTVPSYRMKRYHHSGQTGTTIADESVPSYLQNRYQENHKQFSSVA